MHDVKDGSASIRGSRKHLPEWIERDCFVDEMNSLLASVPATISPQDIRRPLGRATPAEYEIPEFCKITGETCFVDAKVADWWLPSGRHDKGATWDLITTCSVKSQRGLLLVEAKAHESELGFSGKRLRTNASIQSKANHEHIEHRLRKTTARLNKLLNGGVKLSARSHYQIANRVAWSWKLAESGIPAVLLYLGFLGDTYFGRDYFRTDDHFQRAMGAYMAGVVALSLPERTIVAASGGSLTFIIRTLSSVRD